MIEQKNSGWLIKIMFPGKVETAMRSLKEHQPKKKRKKALEFI